MLKALQSGTKGDEAAGVPLPAGEGGREFLNFSVLQDKYHIPEGFQCPRNKAVADSMAVNGSYASMHDTVGGNSATTKRTNLCLFVDV